MLLLCRAGVLTGERALKIAETIHRNNPTHIHAEILRDFRKKLAD